MPNRCHTHWRQAADAGRFSFTYDAAGRRTESIDPLDRIITSIYDPAGRQSQRIDARGNLTTYVYDAGDRLWTRQYPDGQRATFAYDESGNRTRLENHAVTVTAVYDPLNSRQKTTTDYKV